jgi:hypothetical protein
MSFDYQGREDVRTKCNPETPRILSITFIAMFRGSLFGTNVDIALSRPDIAMVQKQLPRLLKFLPLYGLYPEVI